MKPTLYLVIGAIRHGLWKELRALAAQYLRFQRARLLAPLIRHFAHASQRLLVFRNRLAVGGFLFFVDCPKVRDLFGRLIGLNTQLQQCDPRTEEKVMVHDFMSGKRGIKERLQFCERVMSSIHAPHSTTTPAHTQTI